MNIKRKRGFLLLEAITALGIFTIFLVICSSVIKNSITIKNIVITEARYSRNFAGIIENVNREINGFSEVLISEKENKLEALSNIYENEKIKTKKVVYYFTVNELRRYTSIDMEQQKDDIVLENVKGKFFREDEFIKMKIKYKNREEEYVYKQK